MSPAINTRSVVGSVLVSACAIACIASVAQAQYNNFDSDSSSELGKLMRNSGRGVHPQSQRAFNQQAAAAAALAAAATRDAHNQPLSSYGPSHSNRRNYGASYSSALNAAAGYAPIMDSLAAANPRGGSNLNSEISDDDEGSSYGPGFSSNYGESNANNNDDGEGSSVNEGGPASSLDKAASGYPGTQHDFNSEGLGAMNFDIGSEFGPDSSFDSETKRAKSASSPVSSSKNSYESDDDAALPQYGPNSAVNADGEEVLDGRNAAAGYAPSQSDENDNDDE